MALSGVRSSWLMLARNCDLCWLANSQLAALVLDLVEQARILDRDHRLVGEGGGEIDLRSLNGSSVARTSTTRRSGFPRAPAERRARYGPPIFCASPNMYFGSAWMSGTWMMRVQAQFAQRSAVIGGIGSSSCGHGRRAGSQWLANAFLRRAGRRCMLAYRRRTAVRPHQPTCRTPLADRRSSG